MDPEPGQLFNNSEDVLNVKNRRKNKLTLLRLIYHQTEVHLVVNLANKNSIELCSLAIIDIEKYI